MHNIIELKNINKIYGKRVKTQVLNDINLNIAAGSFNSIIGASGSGKTTLLNIIGMLDRPTSGQVEMEGKRIDEMSRRSLASIRNRDIGFVFQFHYLLPEFNAIENVLMPRTIRNAFCSRRNKERAKELLELVGLTKVRKNKVYDLSGGEQQRVAIARALMNRPKIILADEPTGNLDSRASENIYNIFRDINRDLGTTFIIITHDERIAKKTDRIIEIKDGIIT
ncbi:ABC transporter ATP-binding protein [Clostridium algoriphilum]|uniref:ABC transporter ATP-binding protein n=1 Tax=Clostridium algoriphilum TaxID=198347 RepID=UPI001CF4424D|nr:ABC transporter ATP-binding protein [Clostridium algoriphilum]MCB2295334.1 ABC transporter ATP-binding protein [Clostridium algoriphilum]